MQSLSVKNIIEAIVKNAVSVWFKINAAVVQMKDFIANSGALALYGSFLARD